MICKVADLITEIPASGGLSPRCREYLHTGGEAPDIVIREDRYRLHKYSPAFGENNIAYMESAYQFYRGLVSFGGFYLHSSAVVLDGRAYLFSGDSGVGKSTHTRLWQSLWKDAVIINDDKPALRRIDGVWYAYGTPWCGKDGINQNLKAPLAGICFLKQAPENRIRPLEAFEAMQRIMGQTIFKLPTEDLLDSFLSSLDLLVKEVPVYELENTPVPEAARLSYKTMRTGARL